MLIALWQILGSSSSNISWKIESGTPAGSYRIQYFGNSKVSLCKPLVVGARPERDFLVLRRRSAARSLRLRAPARRSLSFSFSIYPLLQRTIPPLSKRFRKQLVRRARHEPSSPRTQRKSEFVFANLRCREGGIYIMGMYNERGETKASPASRTTSERSPAVPSSPPPRRPATVSPSPNRYPD